jgi:CheY-like chemotaxis protein
VNTNKTILVVEDDADQREVITLHLLNAGYMVRSVANGLEAAASCLQITPDIVISDVHMPQMSGFDMMRALKSEPGMQDIPVIFLTVDEGAREEGQDLGAVEFLTKPVKPATLLMLVGKFLATGNRKPRAAQPKAP